MDSARKHAALAARLQAEREAKHGATLALLRSAPAARVTPPKPAPKPVGKIGR